jgi:hypothetical protein
MKGIRIYVPAQDSRYTPQTTVEVRLLDLVPEGREQQQSIQFHDGSTALAELIT